MAFKGGKEGPCQTLSHESKGIMFPIKVETAQRAASPLGPGQGSCVTGHGPRPIPMDHSEIDKLRIVLNS